MPVVYPTGAPMPRALLGWDGTDFYVVSTDAAGQLQIDVLASALPAGAATSANQATMITALQLIDDLRNALRSVGADGLRVVHIPIERFGLLVTDAEQDQVAVFGATAGGQQFQLETDAGGRLSVRGEDQLFSFEDVLVDRTQTALTAADGFIGSGSPGAGEIWVVTTVAAYDNTTACTKIRMYCTQAGVSSVFAEEVRAYAIAESLIWGGHLYMEEGDTMRVYFTGGLIGDACRIHAQGYKMTLET